MAFTYCQASQRYRDTRTGRFISLQTARQWVAFAIGAAVVAAKAAQVRAILSSHPDGNLAKTSAFQREEARRVQAWNEPRRTT